MTFLSEAISVFDKEIRAAQATKASLGASFEAICKEIDECEGRIVITGMGKSGHICRKIVATMQSLGIKAQFMHPAEALHGDLGVLTNKDIVIAVSNSGETEEVLKLIPTIRLVGVKLFCIVGREQSALAKCSREVVCMPEFDEAYLGTLVPSSSTTATLMIGDAMAIAVAAKRNFTKEDFGVFHPNGLLGKRLTLTVGGLMLKDEENAVIRCGSTVGEAVFEMCRKPIGGVSIVDDSGRLKGIFTDGDLRRLYQKTREQMEALLVDDVMTKEPLSLTQEKLIADVIEDMKRYNRMVSFYPVVEEGKLIGALRLLDISKSGLL